MYTVRDYKTKDLLSWHQQTEYGRHQAIAEADMRAKASGRQHMVTNNWGWVLYVAIPEKNVQRAWEIFDWTISAVTFAGIIALLFLR